MPALPGEGSSQAGEIPRRRFRPARVVGVFAIEEDEQPAERPHVLVVVPDDVAKRAGLAPAQEVEVARGNLPAGDVAMAAEAQELGLDGCQARIRHAVAKDAPHDRQQVEVALVDRWVRPGHSEPRDEKRPVEAPTVVRDEPAAARDA